MNRKRKANQLRKNLMRIGILKREELLNKDYNGKIYAKKDWRYCVDIEVNGYRISASADNRYKAFKDAWNAAKWAKDQEPFRERFIQELMRNDFYEEED